MSHPRTVLIHGTADIDVPYETSLAMARSLAACGVEHKLISMQGMDHDLFAEMERDSVLGAWNEALRFLMQ